MSYSEWIGRLPRTGAFMGVMDVRSWGPDGVDLTAPNAARMYDYYLGGSAHFAVDRAAAEQALRAAPGGGDYARATRSFLRRVVRHLVQAGIDQFLDLGSGMPTVGNVHEVAQAENPDCRVAYVDIEPVVVAHARQLLRERRLVTMTQADLRQPDALLSAPGVAGLLDFRRPVAVLAISTLPYVPDSDQPATIMAHYRDACRTGSYLAVSHACPVTVTAEQAAEGAAVYGHTTTPTLWREPEQIATFLPGYQLVPPGLVLLGDWDPDPGDPLSAAATNGYCALGHLR